MTQAFDRYRPSGRFHPRLFVYAPPALLGAVAAAWVYEVMLFHIPFIYVNFLLVAAFGASLGLVASSIVKRAEVRNPAVAYALGAGLALLALAASYGWNLLRFVDLVLEKNPGVSRWAIAAEGWSYWLSGRIEAGWQLKRSTINGAAVWLIWAIEAVTVFACALFVVREEAHRPYCEHCQKWMSTQGGALPGCDRSAVEPLLQAGDVGAVVALPAAEHEGDAPQVALVRAFCPSCSESEYLTVSEIRYSRDTKNQLKEHRTVLVANVLLPLEARAKFTQRFGPAATLAQ